MSRCITSILQLFSRDVYFLLDLDSALFYLTPYMVFHFGFGLGSIFEPFSISTLLGESVIAKKIYMGCVASIINR